MDIIRELTDTELESVSGGQAVAAGAAGTNGSGAGAIISSVGFQLVNPFVGTVTVLVSTALAGAFGD